MKMFEKKWVLVISLLAMVLLMITPVHAYTFLNSCEATDKTVWLGMDAWYYIAGNAQSFKDNVTYTNQVTQCKNNGGNITGTQHYVIMHDVSVLGSVDFSWNTGSNDNSENVCLLEWENWNWTGSAENDFFLLNFTYSTPVVIEYGSAGALSTETYNWWNSYGGGNYPSNGLFSSYGGTPTPPPTPSPTPTPGPTVAPGYVRSTFVTIDATTLYTIHGSNIMLYDTYAGTWTNSTSDADGSLYIDTLPYTIVNAYATFTIFANEFAPAELLGVNVGNAGIDNAIRMYPVSSPPPAGYVNLFVTTMDNNGNVVRDASINALWNSIQHSSSSGTYGTAQYLVPNNTQVRLSASKTGYSGTTQTINVGEGPSYAWTLYLAAQTVTSTPTTTYTTGPGGTVPTTIGPYGTPGPSGTMASGYTNTQGQRMLDFLATNGMGLVELCFMVTILALLGVKLGK